MIKITYDPENPVVYPNKFKPGDTAKCLEYITFLDGTEHRLGEYILVTEETEAYFNVCHESYDGPIYMKD